MSSLKIVMNMKETVSTCHEARSTIFAPANRAERFEKAVSSGTDIVVLNHEDAMPDAEKDEAGAAIRLHWAEIVEAGTPLVMRINPEGSIF